MKTIPLTQECVTIVSNQDYKYISQFNWCVARGGNGRVYARGFIKGKRVTMSRVIMRAESGEEVDHINHDTLDNRRSNLRLVTHSQNSMNRKPQEGRKYKGISFIKESNRWRVYINKEGKRELLGVFTTEEEAAHAYNQAARRLFGKFAYPNKVGL